MKKSDLKTGMQIETRSGERFVILLETKAGDVCVKVGGVIHGRINEYRNDLTSVDKGEDIVKVFESDLSYKYLTVEFSDSYLIWERKEEKPILELDGVEYSESTLRSLIKKATE